MAFQVNYLCDATQANACSEQEFKEMKRALQQNGVHIASLSTNLRNTKEIGEVSRNAESYCFFDSTMAQHIEPLVTKSTDVGSSSRPLLIPIYREKHFEKALERALERAKQSTKNVVIIYDDANSSFNEVYQSLLEHRPVSVLPMSNKISQVLLECGEVNFLIHPNKSKNDDPTPLINYLKQPKGIYVVPYKNFVGMESNSLIFISTESDFSSNATKSFRCNISRAVAQLTIILEMKEDSFDPVTFVNATKILFHSTEVDQTFVKCQKTIKFHAFKCISNHSISSSIFPSASSSPHMELQYRQESSSKILKWFEPEKYVCESCIHVCHNNHKDRIFGSIAVVDYSTSLGKPKFLIWLAARGIRNSIAGGIKCCCNEITECKISNIDPGLDSSHPIIWVLSGLLALFVFYYFLKDPIDDTMSVISDPNFLTIYNVLSLIWSSFRLWFLYQILCT